MDKIRFILFVFSSVKLIPKYFKENKLTYNNVRNFIKGNYRLFTFQDKPTEYKEQIWYRISKADKVCIEKKQCYCECDILGLIQLDKTCDRNCYPIIMDKDTWELYKTINNINELTDFNFGKEYMKNNIDLV